jgi:putative addiction module component (TIGR02574 family)
VEAIMSVLTPESLARLSVEERLKLIDMIWASLADDASRLAVPDWQLEIIRERVAQFRADPNQGRDADEFLNNLDKAE